MSGLSIVTFARRLSTFNWRYLWALVMVSVVLSNCRSLDRSDSSAEPTIPPTTTLTAIPTPPPIPSLTSTPLPSATPAPTPQPTSTPNLISIAVPDALPFTLTLPANYRLTDGIADFTLTIGGEGVATSVEVWHEPWVLAVDFTQNWGEISAEYAQTILNEGHEWVTLLPWSGLSTQQRALRIEGIHPLDPSYPYQQIWQLSGSHPAISLEEAAKIVGESISAEPTFHLTAVGDIMLSRFLGRQIEQGELDYPFAQVADHLRAADYTVGNFESALGDAGAPVAKSYTFQSPAASAESLSLAGFDLVTLANNHALDYGNDALLQGLDLLHAQNIATIGAGKDVEAAHKPVIVVRNGISVGFLGYANVPVETTGFVTESWTATETQAGLAWAYPDGVSAEVAALKPLVDHVIVILHSGYEYVEAPSPPQQAAAEAAVDAGATLVIGHHAHILQGVAFRGASVIAYGLGNFAFEITGDPNSAILNVWLGRDRIHQIEFIPVILQQPGGQPRLAHPWESPEVLQSLYRLTQKLNPAPE